MHFHIRFNTVEPEHCLRDTAILSLFLRSGEYTACKATGPMLLRRSLRTMDNMSTTKIATMRMDEPQNSTFSRTMEYLHQMLEVERKSGRYTPEIGFHS